MHTQRHINIHNIKNHITYIYVFKISKADKWSIKYMFIIVVYGKCIWFGLNWNAQMFIHASDMRYLLDEIKNFLKPVQTFLLCQWLLDQILWEIQQGSSKHSSSFWSELIASFALRKLQQHLGWVKHGHLWVGSACVQRPWVRLNLKSLWNQQHPSRFSEKEEANV